MLENTVMTAFTSHDLKAAADAIATVKAAGPFAKAPKGVPETRMSVTLRFDAP